ncbi:MULTISPECIES: hypothetical protein [Streptomyces]|uniref:Uncharacterized protein n=1 Tax=Streptomyces venezuelae TaxID=54571 RepID=A0A5P2BH62_STRVZ|nr:MULTISPECIES: hypothetical protein [unclassified Streptomyces]MYY83249.1 hypothetical protein [Streptomyces sp. SID335]NDZ85197.1 hypothetical protein [Streptomyces sp. SID10115]NEB45903.1 hypothetical protein [Streptomyces sp. SID339]QES29764.1 hypothetical protein DEJ47_27940 [Streptomyces venezuelae]
MPPTWNWETAEGMLGMDDPAEWDAAYARGERSLGTAVIGLAFHCTPADASPRILKGTRKALHDRRRCDWSAGAATAPPARSTASRTPSAPST